MLPGPFYFSDPESEWLGYATLSPVITLQATKEGDPVYICLFLKD